MNFAKLMAYNAVQVQHKQELQRQERRPEKRARPSPSVAPVRLPQQHQQQQQQPAFMCSPCSKGFRSQELLQVHLDDHEQCSQCPYSACAALMKEHRLLHTPRVQALINMTPEEIAAWREERRRNWPTEDKVRRKQEEKQQQSESQEQKKRSRNDNHPVEKDVNDRVGKRPTEDKKAKQKKAVPNVKKGRANSGLLHNLFSAERKIEVDLLLQCFEHWIDKAAE